MSSLFGFLVNFWPVLLASAVGLLAWGGHGYIWLGLSLLVFLAWSYAQNRTKAYIVGASYYAVTLNPIYKCGELYYPHHGLSTCLLGAASAMLLALPFCLFWSKTPGRRGAGALAILALSALPGLGFVSVACPLTAAGALFPAAGWLGIGATIGLCCSLAARWFWCAVALGVMGIVGIHLQVSTGTMPDSIAAQTHFPSAADNPVLLYQIDEQAQRLVRDSAARVVVLPEGVVKEWNAARDDYWRQTIAGLRERGAIAVIGAGLPIPGSRIPGNGLVVCGIANEIYEQRIPMPIAMWGAGVPLNWRGAGTLSIDGHTPAVLICWEQLLTWPVLQSFAEGADSILAVSNLHWTTGTPIDSIQGDCVEAWAHLFGVPYIRAVNH